MPSSGELRERGIHVVPLQRHCSGVAALRVSMRSSDRNGVTMQQYPRAHVLSSLAVVLDVTGPATIILTAHEIV